MTDNMEPERLRFREKLLKYLDCKLYFQPPENLKLEYPCAIYSIANWPARNADNRIYFRKKQYRVVVIDKSPDSRLAQSLSEMPNSVFEKHYIFENLHHYSFTIFN